MLAPKPKPSRKRTFDPELESVRDKVRATLRLLCGHKPASEANTDSAFFKIAKRNRKAHGAYTEENLEGSGSSGLA